MVIFEGNLCASFYNMQMSTLGIGQKFLSQQHRSDRSKHKSSKGYDKKEFFIKLMLFLVLSS